MVFDFDGVIVESTFVKTAAFAKLFDDRPPEQRNAIVDLHRQNAGVDRYTKFDMIYRDILHERLDATLKHELAARFARLVEDAVVACPMVEGAAELLRIITNRIPAAVVSSTPQDELDRIMARRNLSHHFVVVRGSPPKKTEGLRAVLADKGWQRDQVLMVGDAGADMMAARDNGIDFVGRATAGDTYTFPAGVTVISNLVPLAIAAAEHYAGPPRSVAPR